VSTIDDAIRELIHALREVLAQDAEPNHVLGVMLQQAVTLTGASRGMFVEVSSRGDLTYRVLHQYRPNQALDTGQFSRTLFSTVLSTGEDLLVGNAAVDSRFSGSGSIHELRLVSVLCMPIFVRDRIAALVHLENRQIDYFQPEHAGLLRPLLTKAAPLMEALGVGRTLLDERDRLRDEVEENRGLLARAWSFGRFIGRSSAVRDLEDRISAAARTDSPVLLMGETGTGKSLLARVLHSASARATQPMVTVFCPSLERSMVDAELFGHRRGAFTGAISDCIGKVQAAQGGTLFFDEVGDLPLEIQPKLLRLLQERAYERIGDPEERHADVRVIAATNRALDVEVKAGRFRADLFQRLNFVPIRVPPLRERREDIPALLRHALDQNESGRWVEILPQALDHLAELDFAWPGNVRHLAQLAARLALESSTRPRTADDLVRALEAFELDEPVANFPPPIEAPIAASNPSSAASELDLAAGLPELMVRQERRILEEYLRLHPRARRAKMAADLKISPATLFKKLGEHGLS
jgi:transcriptional regulator with GAF, ATPase, and Fis domain